MTLPPVEKKPTNIIKKNNQGCKKITKKIKVIIFSMLSVVFFASIITISGYLMWNNHFSYNDSEFNSDSDIKKWDDYYHHHQKNQQLIDLTNMTNFLNKNNILLTIINSDDQKKSLNFNNFIVQVDNQLLANNLESKDIINDNNNLLPNDFMQNVVYNPAVDFTVVNKNGEEVAAENFPYDIDQIFGSEKKYQLKMNICSNANAFGININHATKITINMVIKNSIQIDLATINLKYQEFDVAMGDCTMSIANMLKNNPKIEKSIRQNFISAIEAKIVAKNIPDDCYTISYSEPETIVDFSKGYDVKFVIKANDKSKDFGFMGKTPQQKTRVTNIKIDLAKETDLIEKIVTSSIVKPIEVIIKNNNSNDDTNISQDELNDVNNQINNLIKPICQNYFETKFHSIAVSNLDYNIVSNLQVNDNIFNQKKGKMITLTIKPSETTKKFEKNSDLRGIKITIFGKNATYTNKSWNLPKNFATDFDGIWLSDDKKNHYLQNGSHYYWQGNLLKQLTYSSDNNSLLKNISDNSYDVKHDSFSGNFIINGILDDHPWQNAMQFDVAKIKNVSKGINNFWDLIAKTKNIYLYTNVGISEKSRTLNNVKINFYQDDKLEESSLIYSFDLSSLFNAIAIGNTGKENLDFSEFRTDNIIYNQKN